MTIDGVKTIGLIGAGHIGSQVARAAIATGYDVVISNSRGPETLADLASELGPRARAGTPKRRPERVISSSSQSLSRRSARFPRSL
jgi:predicted dinucleotide-binding enzyme